MVQEPPHESDMAPIQYMVHGSYQYEDAYHNCFGNFGLDLITSIMLSLSRLSRRGLLIMIMWLVMERRLLMLGNNNVSIRIIWYKSHMNLVLRVDIYRHNTCLTFLILYKATLQFLIHSCLSNSTRIFSRINLILNSFSDSHNICEIG